MLEHPFQSHSRCSRPGDSENMAEANPLLHASPAPTSTLRVFSGNFQAANQTRHYFDYLWRAWQHVHGARKHAMMQHMAQHLQPFDIAGIQESDADTFRSGRLHQTAFLAEHGDFSHWLHQANRLMGQWASSGNGLLSKYPFTPHASQKLPGTQWFGGRGVIGAEIQWQSIPVVLGVTHLGLTLKEQRDQLQSLQDLYDDHEHVILMRDFNASRTAPHFQAFVQEGGWHTAPQTLPTYPAWNPKKDLDHILVKGFSFLAYETLNWGKSDHLGVSATLQLD